MENQDQTSTPQTATTSGSQAGWTPGMAVQVAATYRHKPSGRLMLLYDADSTANRLQLMPKDITNWKGTSQQFADEFEFVAPYKPENNPPDRSEGCGRGEG